MQKKHNKNPQQLLGKKILDYTPIPYDRIEEAHKSTETEDYARLAISHGLRSWFDRHQTGGEIGSLAKEARQYNDITMS